MAKGNGRYRQNCWDFTDCGRGPGGRHVAQLGLCPAAAEVSADGSNGGINGGRVCWTIAGTYCYGRLQGTYAAKLETCLRCEFCQRVLSEESGGPKGAKGNPDKTA